MAAHGNVRVAPGQVDLLQSDDQFNPQTRVFHKKLAQVRGNPMRRHQFRAGDPDMA
jgi:hypothetical protein